MFDTEEFYLSGEKLTSSRTSSRTSSKKSTVKQTKHKLNVNLIFRNKQRTQGKI